MIRAVAVAWDPGTLTSVNDALRKAHDIHLCGTGNDVHEMLDLLKEHRPDVLVLGLQDAASDGLIFLERLLQRTPLPVVVLASGDARGGRCAVRALELGALEALDSWSLRGRGQSALLEAVRGAHRARSTQAFQTLIQAARRRHTNALQHTHSTVVAIGASTGGTEALYRILPHLPQVTPGIVVTQHLPAGFTAAFADHLNRECQMEVREAAAGDRIRPGLILIAPGDHHLRLCRGRAGLEAAIDAGPRVNRHRPSVDVLFRSVAEHCGADAIGVVLTGMGADGAIGLREMRDHGATTIAQDESTSVVYGMPREAVAVGGAEHVLPLQKIPPALLLAVLRKADVSGSMLRTA